MANKRHKSRKLSLYSNLSHNRLVKRDAAARKHAEFLASLPKNPIKRFFYRINPKHFFAFWFSKRGLMLSLKIIGVSTLLGLLLVGGIFAYFRKDLDSIRPGELAKRVQTTVTTYYDRNGELLWEDKGEGNYKLVVESENLSKHLKNATIAIEDKNFYTEPGISIPGLIRATINNLTGGSTQGGSTLTQQLVKQVFFTDEAHKRGIDGIPRKIKEMILALEVERMYNKDQILTLYLNESPYGGRRNGAESAAQTYFGKAAKDLTIAEAALLAAIPQNPSVFDPYNVAGHAGLISRQHTVLDNMVEQKMITKDEAKEAKEFPIIDHIIPQASQYTNIKAPHFVQMVRAELEKQLGKATVGNGGLIVKTTLDLRVQEKLEEAMNTMFESHWPNSAGFTNGAATVEDTQTGQIIALMGSRDFNYPGYGQDNAAIAYIQPGSTVKPLVYAELFEKKSTGSMNYGSGSIFNDTNIDSIYGAKLYNADRKFVGPITIRSALATSRNVPAVTAMYVSGVKPTITTIQELGAKSYCTQGDEVNVGLASAIGGCGVKQIDMVNAFASLARQGAYKPQSIILEVKNSSKATLKKWSDPASTQVISAQSAYIVSHILNDDVARSPFSGRYATGMYIPNVPTATKTGTSDKGGYAKDIWMISYSPALTMGVWLGNSDATILKQGNSLIPGQIIGTVMKYAHEEVYAKQDLWKAGDWYSQPSGIQVVKGELYPSWWNQTQGQTKTTIAFDKLSKKRATECTPTDAKIDIEVTKFVDPVTKKDVFTSTDPIYDGSKEDDMHSCSDAQPAISVSWGPGSKDNTYTITATVSQGKFPISSVDIRVDGIIIKTFSGSEAFSVSYEVKSTKTSPQKVTASVMDSGYYSNSATSSSEIPAFIEAEGE